jgi:hypothetical protein
MIARYDLREDAFGWAVFEVWTGKPVIVHDRPQIGLMSAVGGTKPSSQNAA